MMISSSTHSNPDRKLTLASSEPEVPKNRKETARKVIPLPEDKDETTLALPEPDSDNITVLTDKLPNKPILPWNRYDSPWEASGEQSSEPDITEELPSESLEK